MPKSICIITLSPIMRDVRALRQVKYLAPHYSITVVSYGRPQGSWTNMENVRWVQVEPPSAVVPLPVRIGNACLLLLGRIWPCAYDIWYRRKMRSIRTAVHAVTCDAFLANKWVSLPVAAEAAREKRAKLVFDAHEFAPLQFEHLTLWKLAEAPQIRHFLKTYGPQADAALSVAPLICDRYSREYGFSPTLVLNAPDRPAPIVQRRKRGVIRLMYHGLARRDRELELMIEALGLCDKRYHLCLMLIHDDAAYIEELQKLARETAPARIVFRPAVREDAVPAVLADHDVGLIVIPPTTFNNRVLLPNKFFDYIVSGLAVCTGPSPSMVEFVGRYGFGRAAESFAPQDIADVLNRTSEKDWGRMQGAAREAAKTLNAEHEMAKVKAILGKLI